MCLGKQSLEIFGALIEVSVFVSLFSVQNEIPTKVCALTMKWSSVLIFSH